MVEEYYCGPSGTVKEWCEKAEIDPKAITKITLWYGDRSCYHLYPPFEGIDYLPDEDFQLAYIYVWKQNRERAVMLQGFDEYMLPGATKPKYTRMLSDDDWNDLFTLAFANHQAYFDNK